MAEDVSALVGASVPTTGEPDNAKLCSAAKGELAAKRYELGD